MKLFKYRIENGHQESLEYRFSGVYIPLIPNDHSLSDLGHGNTHEGLLFELYVLSKSTWCIVFVNLVEEGFFGHYTFPN